MSDGITWLTADDVWQLYEEQIALYGGSLGILHQDAFASTLARPQNLASYNRHADIFDLAASYGYGFAKNHCFVDGNKRIAFMAATAFLFDHTFLFVASTEQTVAFMVDVAAGVKSEKELAAWFRQGSIVLPIQG